MKRTFTHQKSPKRLTKSPVELAYLFNYYNTFSSRCTNDLKVTLYLHVSWFGGWTAALKSGLGRLAFAKWLADGCGIALCAPLYPLAASACFLWRFPACTAQKRASLGVRLRLDFITTVIFFFFLNILRTLLLSCLHCDAAPTGYYSHPGRSPCGIMKVW